jgi:hypothetical protein
MMLYFLARGRSVTYNAAAVVHQIITPTLRHVLAPVIIHQIIKAGDHMIVTPIKNIPDFYPGESWSFSGRLEYSDGSTAPDITGDTVTLNLYTAAGALVFTEDADVSAGSGGYTITAQKAKTNLCTAGQAYEVEIKWYYNAGADNQMLYKGRVNCLRAHTVEA